MKYIKLFWFYTGYRIWVYAILLPVLYIVSIIVAMKGALLDSEYIVRDALKTQKLYDNRKLRTIKENY